MKPLFAISVVIPAYNEEQLIGNCLTSLKDQDFKLPFEIIVVNNNSTDNTVNIAKSFGVKVITEMHQGVTKARQKGLITAQGEIVTGADSDCTYPTNWLTQIYENYQKNPKIVAVGGPGQAQKNPWWAYNIYEFWFGLFNIIYKLTGFVCYLPGFNFSFKREAFLKIGGYHTYLDFGGDEIDPLNRLRKIGKVVYDHKLKIKLSTRRYRVGFFKWFFVHQLYYYMFSYFTACIFKKTLIHPKAVRNI